MLFGEKRNQSFFCKQRKNGKQNLTNLINRTLVNQRLKQKMCEKQESIYFIDWRHHFLNFRASTNFSILQEQCRKQKI